MRAAYDRDSITCKVPVITPPTIIARVVEGAVLLVQIFKSLSLVLSVEVEITECELLHCGIKLKRVTVEVNAKNRREEKILFELKCAQFQ